jgi:hypothetical protein
VVCVLARANLCAYCGGTLKKTRYKLGRLAFCCPEHRMDYYNLHKGDRVTLISSGITNDVIKALFEEKEECKKAVETVKAKPEETVGVNVGVNVGENKETQKNTRLEKINEIFNLCNHITYGFTNNSDGRVAIIEKCRTMDLDTVINFLETKQESLSDAFNRITPYNAKGAIAYIMAIVSSGLPYFVPTYHTEIEGIDNIEDNYKQQVDNSGFHLKNNRLTFDQMFKIDEEGEDEI